MSVGQERPSTGKPGSPETDHPGPERVRPSEIQRSTFPRRYVFWTALSVASAWLLSGVWRGLQTRYYTPHESLYENKTLAEATNLQDIVRPLIDEDQLFDVVATVWSKNPSVNRPWVWGNDEDILFSEPIFRGMTLKSKGARAQVNLSIPLKVFKAKTLGTYDLRASFILVPQEPSLLDGFLEYHSWRPHHWVRAVDVSPPEETKFPGYDFHERADDPKKRAIDSYGITIPLIDFNPIKSSCGNVSNESPNVTQKSFQHRAKYPIESTEGKSPLEYHPFVITRTDLRVVKMTELYNARRYDLLQRVLRTNTTINGCSPYISQDGRRRAEPQDGRNCKRDFLLRANMETKISVEVPSQEKGHPPSQVWTYAPFMDTVRSSWGVMDLVPLPVNREGCPTEEEQNIVTPETLNVTWNVALSFPSPGHIFLTERVLEALDKTNIYGPAITPYEKASAQSLAQHIHWVHGHSFTETAYIGRRIFLQAAIRLLRWIILPRLSVSYWNTRTSTVGISGLGSALGALGGLLSFLEFHYKTWREGGFDDMNSDMTMTGVFFMAMSAYSMALTIGTTFRLERANSFPFFKRRNSTPIEQMSQDMEVHGKGARLATIFAATILLDVAATTFLYQYEIIPRVGPAPEEIALARQGRIFDSIKGLIPGVLPILGGVYQLNLNYQSKTFAGQYKSAARLTLLLSCLSYISNLPWVVGELPSTEPLTLAHLVYLTPSVVGVIQSFIYPDVGQAS